MEIVRKIASVVVVTFALTLIYILEFSIIKSLLKLLGARSHYIYLYHVDFLTALIVVPIIIVFVLIVSAFFRKSTKPKKRFQVSFITGLTSFLFIFACWYILGSTNNLVPLLLTGSASFIIGFLFPIFFKIIHKNPLFTENFY